MERDIITKNIRSIMYCYLMLSGLLAVTGFGYFHGLSTAELIRNSIVAVFGLFTLCAGLAMSIEKQDLLYDNGEHLGRFLFTYTLAILFVGVCGYLPYKVWPVVFFAVALSLSSNVSVGMCSYVIFLLMIALLYGHSASVFYTNIFVGFIGIMMFKNLDKEFHYMGAWVATCISLLVGESAFYMLFEEVRPSLDQYVGPLVNVCVTGLCLLGLLKRYSKKVIHHYQDRYQELIDPEFPLLAQCKKENPKAYYQAMHTAYFCDKIAMKMDIDSYLVRALGYYGHKNVFVDLTKDVLRDFTAYYEFPPELIDGLKELNGESGPLKKKEVVVAYFADAVVSSVRLFYEKNKNVKLDHVQMIQLIFKRKMESGVLKSCELTLKELEDMKNLFIEENLYYDFLR